jgi:nucleoside phosphorylase
MPLVDIALVAGLAVEEFGHLRRLLPELVEDKSSSNTDVWYRGRLQATMDTSYSMVAAFQTDMGPQQAHALISKIIPRWDPAYIILIGIAGSFHSDVRLGDVIAGVQVFFYDPGKATDKGIRYRPEGYPCSATLIRQFQALALDSKDMAKWLSADRQSTRQKAAVADKKLVELKPSSGRSKAARAELTRQRDERRADLRAFRSHQPRVHFGTVASGSLVVASKTLQKRLLSLHGKILGTEMESAGVMVQTFTHEMPTPAIVVKGISDHADPNKAAADGVGYWRELACENSVRLALAMLRRGRIRPLHTDEFVLDPTSGPIEQTRSFLPQSAAPGVALLGFPRLICPRGPVTAMFIDVKATAMDGSALRIDQLKIVHTPYTDDDRDERAYPPGKTVVLKQLAPQPIQVYLLLTAPASVIYFSVRTPAGEQTAQWHRHD